MSRLPRGFELYTRGRSFGANGLDREVEPDEEPGGHVAGRPWATAGAPTVENAVSTGRIVFRRAVLGDGEVFRPPRRWKMGSGPQMG